MTASPHFTSARTSTGSDTWSTPPDLFAMLDSEYGFGLDAAASAENALCPEYLTAEQDALTVPWSGRGAVWLNPPYSRLRDFLAKAHAEGEAGTTIVCLVPSRTDTKAWHAFAMRSRRVLFVEGRLRFGGSSDNAPFPSAVVEFGPGQGSPTFASLRVEDHRQTTLWPTP